MNPRVFIAKATRTPDEAARLQPLPSSHCSRPTMCSRTVSLLVGVALTLLAVTVTARTALACQISEFACRGGSLCLPLDKYCDGRDDCGDASDEPKFCTGEYTHELYIWVLFARPGKYAACSFDEQLLGEYFHASFRFREANVPPSVFWGECDMIDIRIRMHMYGRIAHYRTTRSCIIMMYYALREPKIRRQRLGEYTHMNNNAIVKT